MMYKELFLIYGSMSSEEHGYNYKLTSLIVLNAPITIISTRYQDLNLEHIMALTLFRHKYSLRYCQFYLLKHFVYLLSSSK